MSSDFTPNSADTLAPSSSAATSLVELETVSISAAETSTLASETPSSLALPLMLNRRCLQLGALLHHLSTLHLQSRWSSPLEPRHCLCHLLLLPHLRQGYTIAVWMDGVLNKSEQLSFVI